MQKLDLKLQKEMIEFQNLNQDRLSAAKYRVSRRYLVRMGESFLWLRGN